MLNVIDVSKYIINRSYEIGKPISNLKLQKLLYFVQAKFLVDTNGKSACFSNDIEAWGFGPVVSAAYHYFKVYGSNNIPPYDDCTDSYFNEHDKILINEVIDTYKDYSAVALVNLTHRQDPWIWASESQKRGYSNIIYKDLIFQFFRGKM